MTQIKICGLTTLDAIAAAGPVDFVGLVFYSKSPRAITPQDAARLLAATAKTPKKVGLFVNPTDAALIEASTVATLDMVQLHGDETPERVRAVAALTRLPVMKAVRVAQAADIRKANNYAAVADWLLFDARSDNAYGGTGKSFDWNLLRDFRSAKPWMLSGGLNAANIKGALGILRPDAVDVSSGVESSPGKKDPRLITDFIGAVR